MPVEVEIYEALERIEMVKAMTKLGILVMNWSNFKEKSGIYLGA